MIDVYNLYRAFLRERGWDSLRFGNEIIKARIKLGTGLGRLISARRKG